MRPIFSIGWHEPALLAMGGVIGFLCGLAINRDQEQLRSMLDLVAAHKRADSRLNRVIKVRCDVAAALLDELPTLQALGQEHRMSSETRALVGDIRGMLDQASSW